MHTICRCDRSLHDTAQESRPVLLLESCAVLLAKLISYFLLLTITILRLYQQQSLRCVVDPRLCIHRAQHQLLLEVLAVTHGAGVVVGTLSCKGASMF